MYRYALLTIAIVLAGCERENRRLREERVAYAATVDTAAGPYDHNAYRTTEGQLLFEQMNCSGCHANGGGGMGPPLMDDGWIYGSKPEEIYTSIANGRPNGMPAWKHRLNDKQIWQLVAYVRSLSALTPKGARPSREDHMQVKPAPMQTPNGTPIRQPSPFNPPGR